MEHNGYQGCIEFDAETGLFHGNVMNIHDVVTFQGRSPREIETAFRQSVEDYLAFCKERCESPQLPSVSK
jgi:predicted HicB family RNase H-like nuclease